MFCFINTTIPIQTRVMTRAIRVAKWSSNTRVARQPYSSTSTFSPPPSPRSNWRRFWNPWVDLAHVTPPEALGPMVIQFSNSWSIVSVLLCGLSSASLMGTPHCETTTNDDAANNSGEDKDVTMVSCRDNNNNNNNNNTYHKESIFVSWGILNARDLHDAYIVACSTSFFASGCALGLSIVGSCVAM